MRTRATNWSAAAMAVGLLITRAASATIVVDSVVDVCVMPTTPNQGKVVGFDAGMSTLHGSQSYWFFGDTSTDNDGDWILDGPLEGFSSGTHVGRTIDLAGSDCMTISDYKADLMTGRAVPAILTAPDEHVIWPMGAVSLGGTLYTYYETYGAPGAGDYRGIGLAKLTNVSTLQFTRLPGYIWGGDDAAYAMPLAEVSSGPCGAATFVYLFGLRNRSTAYITRVRADQIENFASYQVWNGTAWMAANAQPTPVPASIFSDTAIHNAVSVAYHADLNRYVAIYTCGNFFEANRLCARHTTVPGRDGANLTKGWSASTEILNCGTQQFACKQAYQHAEYASGENVYVTSSHHSNTQYHLDVRRFQFSLAP
jgi:hypothetical protein